MNLKEFYLHTYQPKVYALSIARAEYEKAGAFISPGLSVLIALKVYLPQIPLWTLPVGLIVLTVSGIWFGEYLIKMGVPKKTAELGNAQNPQLIEILNILRK